MKFLLLAALLVETSVLCAGPADVSEKVERIRAEHRVPAMAVAAMDEGNLVAIGAAGQRSIKREKPVTIHDLWIVSSCTKSMTASLAAMLVEDGLIHWFTTVGEVFPELREKMAPNWCNVTLEQLLTHRAGAPHDPPPDVWARALQQAGSPREQRVEFVAGVLAHAPSHAPGTHWEYSDSGYAIAGAMLERVADVAFEEMLRSRLFEPLGLKSAGFGPPARPGKRDQPWGHLGYLPPYKPVHASPEADYPPSLAPAATVHMSVTDFARYAQWHVDGELGVAPLLTPESFKKLHTPPEGQEYAMGWAVTNRRWAGGTALMHNGDNTMFYAVMWLGPAVNTCFVAVCNADSQEAQNACDEAIRFMINEY